MSKFTKPLSPTSTQILFQGVAESSVGRGNASVRLKMLFYILGRTKVRFNPDLKKIEFDNDHLNNEVIPNYFEEKAIVVYRERNPRFRGEIPESEINKIKEELAKDQTPITDAINDLKKIFETNVASILSYFGETKIYRSQSPRPVQETSESYVFYSPYRLSVASTSPELKITKFFAQFVNILMNTAFIEQQIARLKEEAQANHQEIPTYQFEALPADLSRHNNFQASSIFARDGSVVIGKNLYVCHPRVNKALNDQFNFQELGLTIADFTELTNDGFIKMPFYNQGGNVIVDEKKKIIIMAELPLLEEHYKDKKPIPFVENDKLIAITTKEEYDQKRKEWAEQLGYKLVMVPRKINEKKVKKGKSPSREKLYHLDVFCNVLDDLIMLPEEDIIADEAREELIEIYGKENVVLVTKKEREALCTNFITFGNTVMMSSPNTPKSFADKLTTKGFEVVIPPNHLSVSSNSGIRCSTQVATPFLQEKTKEETLGENDEKGIFTIRHYESSEVPQYKPPTITKHKEASAVVKSATKSQHLRD